MGRAGRERRVIVDLLQDFFRAAGLTEPSETPASVPSVRPESDVCAVGGGESVRGDLARGARPGLAEEHLFGVCARK